MRNFWLKIKQKIERILPMAFNSLVLFAIIIYLLFTVAKTVWSNYKSDQDLAVQQQQIYKAEEDINMLQNEIAYYQTKTYKEKQARAKLGYIAPGEKIISLPSDKPEEQLTLQPNQVDDLKTPNYDLWYNYFFDD